MSQPSYCIWMINTALENSADCQPELRRVATFLIIRQHEEHDPDLTQEPPVQGTGPMEYDMAEGEPEYPEEWGSFGQGSHSWSQVTGPLS